MIFISSYTYSSFFVALLALFLSFFFFFFFFFLLRASISIKSFLFFFSKRNLLTLDILANPFGYNCGEW